MKLQHNHVSPPNISRVSTMPDKPFPPHLKLQRLALAKAEVAGLVFLRDFERLREHGAVSPEALDSADPLALTLSFGFDSEGWLVIKGSLEGELPMICQRCLDPYLRSIVLPISLARVANEKDLGRLPSEYEPLLHDDESIKTVDLIEDDVLLSLPLVPMHPPEECSASFAEAVIESVSEKAEVAPSAPKRENPFKVLEVLKSGASAQEED